MVKRPSIWILCFFMIGIVCNKYICSIFGFIPIILLACLSSFLFFHHLKQKYFVNSDFFILLLPFFLCLGYFLPTYYALSNHLPDKYLSTYVTFQGKVTNVLEKSNYQEIYLYDVVVQVDNLHVWVSQIMIQDTSEFPCVIGDKLTVQGEITEFDAATNPGQYDSKAYYEAKGVRYKVWEGKIIGKVSGKIPLYRSLSKLKTRVSHTYHTVLTKEDSEILHAMVLGDKSELSSELKTLYQKAGISHILAISGLHISMIGLLLFKLLKKAGLHHNLASVICMILVYLYGVMTGFSVSTNRAVVMMCLSLSACLVSRTYDSQSAIAVSGFFILFQQPYQLFQCGFQLSFLAVVGVIWFCPVCKEYMQWLSPDFEQRIKQKENSEYYSLGVWLNRFTKLFRSTLLVSCCIQIVTLPVLLFHFYEVASLAPILNLFILPLASLLMILAILIALLGSCWLPLGYFLSGGVHYILMFYHFLCDLFQSFGYQTIITGRPKNWQIAVYVLAIGLFCYGVYKKLNKAVVAFVPIALILLFLRIPVSGLEVTMIDVGQGDSIFIEARDGFTCLVDGGSTSVKAVGTYRIAPFLKYKGVKNLDYCFLSHMDEDHTNGIQELIEESIEFGTVKIQNLVLPHLNQEDEAYKDMITMAKQAGIRVVYMEQGQQIKTKQIRLKCLHPSYGFETRDRNSSSLVLELSYESFCMLLTGDVDEIGEKSILSSRGILKKQYDVLKVAHHGSKGSTCKEWLEKTKPRAAMISCGKKNRYGHPHTELLERLKESNMKVWRTDEGGALTIKVGKGRYGIRTYLHE